MLTRLLVAAAAAAVALSVAASAMAGGAGGVTGPSFFVDGKLYRTVGTPTDLSGTGAPASSFDTIYEFGGLQPNVATAAPGDPGYNGGRWRVQVLGFNPSYAAALAYDANGSGNLDSDEELGAAFAAGVAYVAGPGPSFVCPVIKVPKSG